MSLDRFRDWMQEFSSACPWSRNWSGGGRCRGPDPSVVSTPPFTARLLNTLWTCRDQRQSMTPVTGRCDRREARFPANTKGNTVQNKTRRSSYEGLFVTTLNYSLSDAVRGTSSPGRLKGLLQKGRDVVSVMAFPALSFTNRWTERARSGNQTVQPASQHDNKCSYFT